MHLVCVLMTTVTSVTFSCIFYYDCSILCVLFMFGVRLSYNNKWLTYLLQVLNIAEHFTPDLKLISFTNPFLHSHSYSFRTDFTDLKLLY